MRGQVLVQIGVTGVEQLTQGTGTQQQVFAQQILLSSHQFNQVLTQPRLFLNTAHCPDVVADEAVELLDAAIRFHHSLNLRGDLLRSLQLVSLRLGQQLNIRSSAQETEGERSGHFERRQLIHFASSRCLHPQLRAIEKMRR
ncbi:hypothetical protein D3C87_1427540 [compost metagenome]